MVVIKVTYGNDIRRITIDGSLSYKDLRTLLKKLHHNTLPAHFEIKYLDDENDKVTISCDRELAEALEFVQTAKQPLLRVILSEGKKKEAPATAPLPTPPAEVAFSPNQLLEVIEAALSSPEVQQTWETVQGTFTTCVDQAVREGRTAAHYVQQHPQFARVQHLLTERLPQAIHNDLNTTLPQLVNDIQGIFANISIPAAPRPPVPAAAAPATPPVVHHAICDACEKHIVGIRYKCTTCPDFDLCEACEAKPGTHDSAHYFLKLRTQLPWGLELTRIVPPSATTTTSPIGRASRCPYFQPQQQHQHQQQQQQQQDRTGPQYQGPRPRHHFGRGFTLSARFVSDVSIDDGTVLAPNATFVKVWRLRNDGERAWPEGTTLTHLFGPRLAKVGAVSVPALPAGEEVDIAVEMVAPSEAGHYVSNWRLAGPRGYKFGHRIWADITVQPVDVPAAEEEVKPAPVEAEPQEEQPVAEDSSSSSDSDEEFEVVELEKVEEAAPVEAEPQEKVEEVAQPEPEPEVEQPAVSIPIEAAPVPAPTPAPAPEGEEDDMVRLILDQLEQMGFQDRARNNRLLLRNRGNVLATIHQLLDM